MKKLFLGLSMVAMLTGCEKEEMVKVKAYSSVYVTAEYFAHNQEGYIKRGGSKKFVKDGLLILKVDCIGNGECKYEVNGKTISWSTIIFGEDL